MKHVLYVLLSVMILIGVNSAPKNNKNNKGKPNKKCNQCRIKGQDIFSPICGRLDEVEDTFESIAVFECFAKCRKVQDFEFLYDGECRKTREQCKAQCDKTTRLSAPPACEGHPSGRMGLTTHPYEALLDCYIKCPDNNLTKLHQGPCIEDRHHPIYKTYGALAPYHICFNGKDESCKARKLRALFLDYPVLPTLMNFYRYF